jgi:hypothetical protein
MVGISSHQDKRKNKTKKIKGGMLKAAQLAGEGFAAAAELAKGAAAAAELAKGASAAARAAELAKGASAAAQAAELAKGASAAAQAAELAKGAAAAGEFAKGAAAAGEFRRGAAAASRAAEVFDSAAAIARAQKGNPVGKFTSIAELSRPGFSGVPEPPFSKGIFSRPGFFGSSGTTAGEFGTFGARPPFGYSGTTAGEFGTFGARPPFGSSGTTAEEFATLARPSFGAAPQSVVRSQAPVSIAEIESLHDPFKLRALLSPQELREAGLLKPNLSVVELQSGVKAQLRQKGRLLTESRQAAITAPTGSRSFASKASPFNKARQNAVIFNEEQFAKFVKDKTAEQLKELLPLERQIALGIKNMTSARKQDILRVVTEEFRKTGQLRTISLNPKQLVAEEVKGAQGAAAADEFEEGAQVIRGARARAAPIEAAAEANAAAASAASKGRGVASKTKRIEKELTGASKAIQEELKVAAGKVQAAETDLGIATAKLKVAEESGVSTAEARIEMAAANERALVAYREMNTLNAQASSVGSTAAVAGASLERETAALAARTTPAEAAKLGESLDVSAAEAKSVGDASLSFYERIFGKSPIVIVTPEGAAAVKRTFAGAEVVISEGENAVGLLESVKAYTPYGRALSRLTETFKIGVRNIGRFEIVARNILNVPRNIKKYNDFVNQSIKILLEYATKGQIENLLTVFRPQRMIDFKIGLVRVFQTNAVDAGLILDTMLLHIIPKSNYNIELIDALINTMKNNPSKAVEEMLKVNGLIRDDAIRTIGASAQAYHKGMGWFKSKAYYSLLFGIGGASVLFLANYNNIPDMKTFAERVYWWKESAEEDLEENPNYTELRKKASAFRKGITLTVIRQFDPEYADELERQQEAANASAAAARAAREAAKNTWMGYFLRQLGLDDSVEGRQRKEQLEKMGKKAGPILIGASVGVGAAAAGIPPPAAAALAAAATAAAKPNEEPKKAPGVRLRL